jgi:hypothetical protein
MIVDVTEQFLFLGALTLLVLLVNRLLCIELTRAYLVGRLFSRNEAGLYQF